MIVRELGAHPQHIGISNAFISAGLCADFKPLWPFHLDRWDGEKKRAREASGRTQSGLRDGLFGGKVGDGFGQCGRGVLRRQVVDGPGDSGL